MNMLLITGIKIANRHLLLQRDANLGYKVGSIKPFTRVWVWQYIW